MTVASVELSVLDEQQFGIPTAKAPALDAGSLPAALEFCRAHRARLLIARCPVTDTASVHAMERAGFLLMDTLVHWVRELDALPPAGPVSVRSAGASEVDAVAAVAAEAFRDYRGHYHADPRLERARCDGVYVSWARRCCVDRAVADVVLVADLDGRAAGFGAFRRAADGDAMGLLFGVARSARRRGIYASLLSAGMAWARGLGSRRLRISTQITNLDSQRRWTSLGFQPDHAVYTFHKWFDESP